MKYIISSTLLIIIFVISSCEPIMRIHGYIPRDSEIAMLQLSVTHKNEIIDYIGSPSFINEFDNNRWYYVSFQTSQVGSKHPKVIDYRILQLIFDENNILKEINKYDKEDLLNVVLDTNITPASGRNITIIEQMLNNIGKFN